MVAVGAIIGKRESSDALVFDAIETGEVNIAISDDCLIELVDVVGRPSVANRIKDKADALVKALSLGLNMGTMGFLMHPRRLHWPNLADPKDGWILDLALQAAIELEDREIYIVSRDTGVLRDAPRSGFVVLTPPLFVKEFKIHR